MTTGVDCLCSLVPECAGGVRSSTLIGQSLEEVRDKLVFDSLSGFGELHPQNQTAIHGIEVVVDADAAQLGVEEDLGAGTTADGDGLAGDQSTNLEIHTGDLDSYAEHNLCQGTTTVLGA